MLPIDEQDDKLPIVDDTIYVSVSGVVTSSSKQNASFHMYTKQYVCGQPEPIAVRGVMNKNAKWKNPLQLLPDPNSIVGFDGILDKFKTYTPEHTHDKITCAVVAVQDITFHVSIKEEEQGTKAEKTAMRDKLKNRRHKTKTKNPSSLPTTPDASQSSSLPSTSQKTLGKRKVTISEDEIENVTSL